LVSYIFLAGTSCFTRALIRHVGHNQSQFAVHYLERGIITSSRRVSDPKLLKIGHFEKYIKNAWKIVKYLGEGWSRLVGMIV